MSTTGNPRMGSNILGTAARQGAAVLIGVGFMSLMGHQLGADGVGSWSMAVFLPMLLATMFELGAGAGNAFHLGRRDVAPGDARRATMGLWFWLSMIG